LQAVGEGSYMAVRNEDDLDVVDGVIRQRAGLFLYPRGSYAGAIISARARCCAASRDRPPSRLRPNSRTAVTVDLQRDARGSDFK